MKQHQAVDGAKNKLLSYTENLNANEITALKNRIHVIINTKKYLVLDKKPKATRNILAEMDKAASMIAVAENAVSPEHMQQAEELAKTFKKLTESLPLG